jgi:glycosyltransferase involved in cell wall biosynthesis
MKTLQIATNTNHSFFLSQVEELERKGIECDVVTASLPRATYNEWRGPILTRVLPDWGHHLPYYAINALVAHPRIVKTILENDYDLIHANSGLTAPFALLQPDRPVVQTFWGSDLMGDYLYGQYDHVCKFCARRFDAAIVRNEAMKRKLGMDAHVIPAGVDMETFKPMPKDEARESVGWSPEKRHVLFPYAPRRERKNYPLAKEVVDRVNERVDDEVVLQAVHGVDHDRIPVYMNASDALILTSKLEGSPNTVKEALACNLPVVSTDVGDVRERLRDVHPSTVANGTDELVGGLVDVIEHEGRCNGRKRVEPLSWDRIGDRIIGVYDDVL